MQVQKESAINFPEMMARNLKDADKVIVVLSENYKKKADSFKGGVGKEYRYIINDISENKKKYVLVSFEQDVSIVQPDFLAGNQVVILNKNNNGFNELLHKLNDSGEYIFPDVNPIKTEPKSKVIFGKENLIQRSRPSENRGVDTEWYNLLVSAADDAWENDSYIMSLDRCLRSFTSAKVKELFDYDDENSQESIRSYPCIFAYEDCVKKDAYIGYITNMLVREKGIKFYIEKEAKLLHDDLHKMAFEFDIDLSRAITELMHTHWTIKKVNLYKELSRHDVQVEYLSEI